MRDWDVWYQDNIDMNVREICFQNTNCFRLVHGFFDINVAEHFLCESECLYPSYYILCFVFRLTLARAYRAAAVCRFVAR